MTERETAAKVAEGRITSERRTREDVAAITALNPFIAKVREERGRERLERERQVKTDERGMCPARRKVDLKELQATQRRAQKGDTYVRTRAAGGGGCHTHTQGTPIYQRHLYEASDNRGLQTEGRRARR